jgi:hypothetical protein
LPVLGTFLNPFGGKLWTVPFKLATLVKTETFYNPEWLRPPIGRFPLFYVAFGIALAAGLVSTLRAKKLPEARLLVALAMGALASQQMRHLGLFAIAWFMASASMMRALDPARSRRGDPRKAPGGRCGASGRPRRDDPRARAGSGRRSTRTAWYRVAFRSRRASGSRVKPPACGSSTTWPSEAISCGGSSRRARSSSTGATSSTQA